MVEDDLQVRARTRLAQVLRDKYRLDRVLGVGGMATVYAATHLRNANRVAVKILHPELSLDASLRARFLREGYVGNIVEHPGTVRVLDDDKTDDGAVFLVMELLEGETLDARWERSDKRLALGVVVGLLEQLLDALAAAHAKGVVHRDLKPENLFVTKDERLKVLDFGIARLREGSATRTKTGAIFGTPAFMPPEQALGRMRDVDALSDVWAVGATAFTLLSGRFVHPGETPEELLIRSATQPAPSLATVAPDVPAEVTAVIDRALAFDKADRWQSAEAMRDALKSAVAERAPSAKASDSDSEKREFVEANDTYYGPPPDLGDPAATETLAAGDRLPWTSTAEDFEERTEFHQHLPAPVELTTMPVPAVNADTSDTVRPRPNVAESEEDEATKFCPPPPLEAATPGVTAGDAVAKNERRAGKDVAPHSGRRLPDLFVMESEPPPATAVYPRAQVSTAAGVVTARTVPAAASRRRLIAVGGASFVGVLLAGGILTAIINSGGAPSSLSTLSGASELASSAPSQTPAIRTRGSSAPWVAAPPAESNNGTPVVQVESLPKVPLSTTWIAPSGNPGPARPSLSTPAPARLAPQAPGPDQAIPANPYETHGH